MKQFKYYYFTAALLTVFLLGSCSSKESEKVDLGAETSKFIKANGNIVMFGKVALKGLIQKANLEKKKYDQVSIVTDEMGKLQRALNLDVPVYFAFEGPLKSDGSPEVAYIFMEAKSDTAMINELESRGYSTDKAGDITYSEDGDFAIGVKNRLAIAIIKRGQSEAKKDLKSAYKKLKGDVSGGKVDIILAELGDIVFGTSLEGLYKTSKTDLEKLDEKKKNELNEMVTDSYVQTAFFFEKGQLLIESKNLFSDALMKIMPFREDPSAKLLAKVNQSAGTPVAGLAVNMDVSKMEAFMNNYSPETVSMIFKSFGFGGNVFGGLPVASMTTNGQAAALFTADVDNNAMHLNFFVNASKLGRDITEDKMKSSPMSSFIKLRQDNDGLIGSFVLGDTMSFTPETIELPAVCDAFGKKGVTFFLYLDEINVEDFGMFGPMELLEDVKYALFEVDNNGAKLLIKSKKADVNFLENSTDVALDFLSDKVHLLDM